LEKAVRFIANTEGSHFFKISQTQQIAVFYRKKFTFAKFFKRLLSMKINALHHVAVICSNYAASKAFYTDVLGFEIKQEVYRAERQSYKLDLMIAGHYQIELFSFPNPPKRPSRPEACGLRHMAFEVDSVEDIVVELTSKNIDVEPIRIDEFTDRKFTFIADPDGLPIEFYEKQI
jgi:glyoxylase I family protein